MDLPDLEAERDIADGVEQIGGGDLPGTDDHEERGKDQNDANSCRQHRSPETERAGADAEVRSQRLSFGGLLTDCGKQCLGDHQQQIKGPDRCRRDDDSQGHECGEACIAGNQRERDEHRD